MKVAKSLWDGLLAIAVYNDSFYYVKNILSRLCQSLTAQLNL